MIRRQKAMTTASKEKAEGTYREPGTGEEEEESWGRGTHIKEAYKEREKHDEMFSRPERPKKTEESEGSFARGNFSRQTTAENRPPMRKPREDDEGGFLSRSGMASRD